MTITVTGIAKGSGMICPDMATMLAYIATDMPVAAGVLDECLHRAVAVSFNCAWNCALPAVIVIRRVIDLPLTMDEGRFTIAAYKS